jgi:uncharacterized membrane protein HdeD (DUF308 family)
VRGVLVLLFGCLVILAPFFAGPLMLFLGGLLLIGCGILEMLESFRAPDDPSLRSTYLGGALSILAGTLLLSTPELVLKGVALVLAASFLIDGLGKGIAAVRGQEEKPHSHNGRAFLFLCLHCTILPPGAAEAREFLEPNDIKAYGARI